MKDLRISATRRALIRSMGLGLAAMPLIGLSGCGGESGTGTDDTASGDDSESGTSGSTVNSTQWLSGGTAAMEAAFPPTTDPFVSGLGNLCQITEAFTIGPCFFDVSDDRDDISEGQNGVPMTLALKLVDNNCQPIENAQIEVWWCNAEGLYSGDNSDSTGSASRFSTSFCTDNDSEALAARWFRGIKTTDSDGNVYFKACFPGWYPSRTTHIHFRIVLAGTQQLCRNSALTPISATTSMRTTRTTPGSQKILRTAGIPCFRQTVMRITSLRWNSSRTAQCSRTRRFRSM